MRSQEGEVGRRGGRGRSKYEGQVQTTTTTTTATTDNDDDNHGNRRFVCVLNVVRYKEGCRAERPSAAAAPLLFHEIYVTF